MRLPRRRSLPPVPALLLAIAAACGGDSFEAPPPALITNGIAESLPPVPPSRIEVPVRYDLAPSLAWLEREVPAKIGNIDQRLSLPGNDRVHFAFEIEREPFRFSLQDRTITISSVLHYQGRGWYNAPLLPEVSGSCGTGDEQPRARVTLKVTGRIRDGWMLWSRSTVSAQPLTDTERDQCEVTVVHIDVTDKVLGAAAAALQKELAKLDRAIAAFPLRPEVEKIWGTMQEPLRLTDSLWLLIQPVSLRFLPPTLAGDTLLWQAGLEAHPRILGGPKPPASTNPLLPPERDPPPPPELRILSEGRLPYDVAEEILSRALAKTKIKVGRRTITIRHLKPSPLGDGRVVVALTVTGAANGILYAVGSPRIDSAGVLTMPDLAIDAGTTDALTGVLAWLAATDKVTALLQEAIRVNLAPTIEKGRQLAEENMNRELAPGLFLRTTLDRATPIGVWAGPDALIARVLVEGQSAMDVRLYPPTDTPEAPPTSPTAGRP